MQKNVKAECICSRSPFAGCQGEGHPRGPVPADPWHPGAAPEAAGFCLPTNEYLGGYSYRGVPNNPTKLNAQDVIAPLAGFRSEGDGRQDRAHICSCKAVAGARGCQGWGRGRFCFEMFIASRV